MSYEVKVLGIAETNAKIGLFEIRKKKEMIELVGNVSKSIAKVGRQGAPVSGKIKKVGKSGDLKRSIRAKIVGDRTGIQRTVAPRRPKGSHRHWIAYGTDIRRTKKGKYLGKISVGNDFMQRAENSQKEVMEIGLRRIMDVNEVI